MEGSIRRPTGRRFREKQPDLTIHTICLPKVAAVFIATADHPGHGTRKTVQDLK